MSQRELKQWLLRVLKSWWGKLVERHELEQGGRQISGCRRCGKSGVARCGNESCRECCTLEGYQCCCYTADCLCWNEQDAVRNGGDSGTGHVDHTRGSGANEDSEGITGGKGGTRGEGVSYLGSMGEMLGGSMDYPVCIFALEVPTGMCKMEAI